MERTTLAGEGCGSASLWARLDAVGSGVRGGGEIQHHPLHLGEQTGQIEGLVERVVRALREVNEDGQRVRAAKTTRMSRIGSRCLSSLSTSSPERPGIARSTKTPSGAWRSAKRSPSAPLAASSIA